jgi:hypothetical protein
MPDNPHEWLIERDFRGDRGGGGGHIVNRKPTAEAGWDDEAQRRLGAGQ